MMIFLHASYIQMLNTYDLVFITELSARLMKKVISDTSNFFMYHRNDCFLLLIVPALTQWIIFLSGVLFHAGKSSLLSCKTLLILRKRLWCIHTSAVAVRIEFSKPDVDSNFCMRSFLFIWMPFTDAQ